MPEGRRYHQPVRPRAVCTLACVAVVACSTPAYPPMLFVPADAQQLQVTKQYGGGVTYDVLRLYPADAFLTREDEQLRKNGFQPQTVDPFGQATSQRQGWFEYTDNRRTPNTRAAQRISYWKKQTGDQEMAPLRYTTPIAQS